MAMMEGSNAGDKYPTPQEVEKYFKSVEGVTTPYRLGKKFGLGGAQGTKVAKDYAMKNTGKLVAIRDKTTELVMVKFLPAEKTPQLKDLIKEGIVFDGSKLSSGTTRSEFVGEEALTEKEVSWTGRK